MEPHRILVEGVMPRLPAGQNPPPRLEISTFVEHIRQFSLYVQALQQIYDQHKEDVTSYWQIAGIHGQPYVEWNGTSSENGRGFCAHNTEIFPTWHRPYLALFEQEIQRHARNIAATYTHDRPAWEAIAAELRQPYWGWDKVETMTLPAQVTTSPTVEIIKPDNLARVSVPNPFLTYAYPAGENSVFAYPFNVWPRTARYPDASGKSQPILLNKSLKSIGSQVENNVKRLFSITNWNEFVLGSETTVGLEFIHGTMHFHSGGPNGNMSHLQVSAFDPIFYLHHAQVDRMVDLWHSVHKDWTKDTKDLLPFLRTQTDYWQSPEIIKPGDVFNYTYDNDLSVSGESLAEDKQNTDIVSTEVQWSVRVECKMYEVGGSFSVYVFMSKEVPSDHPEWLFHPSFAGTFDVFANPEPEECANCTAHAGDIIKGFVHINQKLETLNLDSLDPENVIPYLKEHISWGVLKSNGEVFDLQRFTSLKVTVICTPITLTVGAKYPKEGQPKIYPEVTRGRVGGYRDGA
ncbi:Polyphenol oxidase 1 [Psilocybe cubensis]|uniref:Polyphenol oxidase 1 n=2 Tax=Psilocybe cubensis TaxID=181762 RepID=A0ACB8H9N0_PSICU|nr:Polyphenol oxidase 1 [Psilocybe cubensis]KAH9484705.1 Polyphenol oxidase 1 [Psilocybe cubensis]